MIGPGVMANAGSMLKTPCLALGSKQSCFLSGNSLRTVDVQCRSRNASRQIVSMSRYTGPRLRIVRRMGELPGLTKKVPRNPAPPGQHGSTVKKPTQYGLRLMEKQKLRLNYGITEHQLINYVKKARQLKGSTGEILLQLLEMRLDSIVFRLGKAPTMSSARQMVNHGHITVNGRRVDIPSYTVQVGEKIGVVGNKRSQDLVKAMEATSRRPRPMHLSSEAEGQHEVLDVCSRPDVSLPINELLIVEYYSRKV